MPEPGEYEERAVRARRRRREPRGRCRRPGYSSRHPGRRRSGPRWSSTVLAAEFGCGRDPCARWRRPCPMRRHPASRCCPTRRGEREWLKDFRPMRFGRRLLGMPERACRPAIRTRSAVELEPGLAFGTGRAPAAALCLEWLDAQDVAGRQVVGPAAVPASWASRPPRLGVASVLAMDIDPQALMATRDNARAQRRRGPDRRRRRPATRGPRHRPAAGGGVAVPLVELAPKFAQAIPARRPPSPADSLLLEQADTVTAAYRPWV